MKTFIVSLFIFTLIAVLVVWNALYIGNTADALLTLAESLPQDKEAFERGGEETAMLMDSLYGLWDDRFPRLAFTAGYDNINRADDAVLQMRVCLENDNPEDFCVARAIFCDGIKRLRSLEGFSFHGIFG